MLRIGVYANTVQHPEQDLAVDPSGMQLATGVSYTFKLDVTDNASGGSHFALKVWPTGTTEPSPWTVETDGELSRGSILLVLHEAEASFGTVTVTPL